MIFKEKNFNEVFDILQKKAVDSNTFTSDQFLKELDSIVVANENKVDSFIAVAPESESQRLEGIALGIYKGIGNAQGNAIFEERVHKTASNIKALFELNDGVLADKLDEQAHYINKKLEERKIAGVIMEQTERENNLELVNEMAAKMNGTFTDISNSAM